ncbi:MAG TPA: OsmC family protein [Flavobacteriales bacterium]
MERTSKAHWKGDLRSGTGTLSTQSGVLNNAPYTFMTRFENGKGTNPEELVGAAHAGCFTMSVAANLTKAGHTAEDLSTEAIVTLDQVNGAPTVTKIHLKLHGKVPGIDQATFEGIAEEAKKYCVISRLINAEITLEVTFG